MKRIHILAILFILESISGMLPMAAQPLPIHRNTTISAFLRTQDQTITYTQTQLAVRHHGSTIWQVHDMPYDTARALYDGPYVFHAAADTILAVRYTQYAPPATSVRLAVFKSEDGGKTWREFFHVSTTEKSSNNCVRYLSGHVVVFYNDEQGILHSESIGPDGRVRYRLEFGKTRLATTTVPLDGSYCICTLYQSMNSCRIVVDTNGIISSTPIPTMGSAWTETGLVPYQRFDRKLVFHYPTGPVTIEFAFPFDPQGTIALFDGKVYTSGVVPSPIYREADLPGIYTWDTSGRLPRVRSFVGGWQNPAVHGDTMTWGNWTGIQYIVKGTDSVISANYGLGWMDVNNSSGWLETQACTWIDSSLCYYPGKILFTTEPTYNLHFLSLTASDSIHSDLSILPFRPGLPVYGMDATSGGNERRLLVDRNYEKDVTEVYDIRPSRPPSLRYEGSELIQFWYQANDTVWCNRYGGLFMSVQGQDWRLLGTLGSLSGRNVYSMARYMGYLYLIAEGSGYSKDSSVLLRYSLHPDSSGHVTRIIAWKNPSYGAFAELVTMDSSLTITGLHDSITLGTTYDGLHVDHPRFPGPITQQGRTRVVVRPMTFGTYEIATTSGRSLTPVDTIPFHPYRTILGAYIMKGSIAIVTNEGTWLFPSIPLGSTTNVEESGRHGTGSKGRQSHEAISIRLPYDISVAPSPFTRQIDIYDIDGRLVSSHSIAPGNTHLVLREIPRGAYFIHIPEPDGPDIRRYLVE